MRGVVYGCYRQMGGTVCRCSVHGASQRDGCTPLLAREISKHDALDVATDLHIPRNRPNCLYAMWLMNTDCLIACFTFLWIRLGSVTLDTSREIAIAMLTQMMLRLGAVAAWAMDQICESISSIHTHAVLETLVCSAHSFTRVRYLLLRCSKQKAIPLPCKRWRCGRRQRKRINLRQCQPIGRPTPTKEIVP